jgi:hypothetical protein
MSAKPLAEAYEKLKELRRQGELPEQATEGETVRLRTGHSLLGLYGGFVGPGVPELISMLDADNSRLTRLLEIVPLADRIFGDEQKAETWLNRPNPSFSGQKPIDLLKDELGAAVVREALEQIDHGIFS